MKWLVFSLLVLGGLALSLTLFSEGQGAAAPAAQKMSQGLQTLCALYQDLGVQTLRQVTRSQLEQKRKSAGSPEQLERLRFLQKAIGYDATVNFKKTGKAKPIAGLEFFLNPVVARRWGNPAFDVASGFLTAAVDPRRLESPYLKLRGTFQKDGKWHAFCEFAIHKAAEIASHPDLRYLKIQPVPKPENDLGSASTSAPRLRVGEPGNWDGSKGYTGQGVIVGDVDTGLDWTHGDFLNPDGSSRVLYLWDTEDTSDINTPADLFGLPFDYGRIWTKAEIDGGLCTATDSNGHGTHTCGTAAGNGGATGKYTGMAPNADIIFVKGLDPLGVWFVFEAARQLGRPAVVNNSWGISWYPYGPYYGWVEDYPGDGSDEYSYFFNFLMSIYPKSAVIVKSAGNNGMWQTYRDHDDYGWAMYDGSLHFGGRTNYGGTTGHVYHRINHDFGQGGIYEYNDFMFRSNVPVQVKISFLGTGQSFTMQTGGAGYVPGTTSYGYYNSVYNLTGQDANNGEYMGFFWMDNSPYYWGDNPFPEGDWSIVVTPLDPKKTAKYDMWLYSDRAYWTSYPYGYRYMDSCFRRNSSHDEYQLDWAASPDVITVGAWTTRSYYNAADGYSYYPWGFLEPKVNTITYFSSPGPSRDGRMKPDIAAPGAVIMSAASKDAGWGNSDLDPDMAHGWMWGTSMAAPHATGAVALYFQKFPGHTFANVRYYLSNWAKKDTFTRSIGKKGFGAGKLNVSNLKTPPVAKLTADKGVLDLSNHDFATFSGTGSYDPDKLPYKYKWVLLAKPTGSACQFTPSGNTAKLVPDKVGAYKVSLVIEGVIYNSPAAVLTVQAVE